ncbi:MAG: AlpA family phage regulatory protein [Sulfurovum sp.]|nr:AlpA family phage regulatory protein [Sulfurovum sp.]
MRTEMGRIQKVMERTGLCKSTIWLWAKEGKFPKAIKLSRRVTVWNMAEIDAWLKSKEGK